MYRRQREWSDQFLNRIKEILGRVFFTTAPYEEDTKHNTDLLVLTANATRIAARVRQHRYLSNYGTEVTIRSKLDNGWPTELDKIREGWGNSMIYAFANADHTDILRWTVLDLDALRIWFSVSGVLDHKPHIPNGDGTYFHAFSLVREVPSHCVYAASWHVTED